MLEFCCCGAGQRAHTEWPPLHRRSTTTPEFGIRVRTKGSSVEKFDVAIATNDLPGLVQLLDSEQSIQCAEQMHTWAENPRSIGALVAARLGMLAQATGPPASMRAPIGDVGAIPKLVLYLKSKEIDRVQTAMIALSFLTADCPKNATEAYEAGAIALLVGHLTTKVLGMRGAAATTLRNICLENPEYRRQFVQQGGLDLLVRQIPAHGLAPEIPDAQLEMVLALYDIIEAEDSPALTAECMQRAIDAGAEQELQKLLSTEDGELRCTVEEVLASLAVANVKFVQKQDRKNDESE